MFFETVKLFWLFWLSNLECQSTVTAADVGVLDRGLTQMCGSLQTFRRSVLINRSLIKLASIISSSLSVFFYLFIFS